MVQYFEGRRGTLWQGPPKGSWAAQWRRSGVAGLRAALELATLRGVFALPAVLAALRAVLAGRLALLRLAGLMVRPDDQAESCFKNGPRSVLRARPLV